MASSNLHRVIFAFELAIFVSKGIYLNPLMLLLPRQRKFRAKKATKRYFCFKSTSLWPNLNVSSQQQVRPIYEDNADCVLLYACGWQEYSSLPRFQMILISVRFEGEPSLLPSSFNIKFATNLPQHGPSQNLSNAHTQDPHDDQHDDPSQCTHSRYSR